MACQGRIGKLISSCYYFPVNFIDNTIRPCYFYFIQIDYDEKSNHTEAFKRVRRVKADTGRLMKCISESGKLNEVGFPGSSRYRAGVYKNPQSSGR